jgi:hypothetical protein
LQHRGEHPLLAHRRDQCPRLVGEAWVLGRLIEVLGGAPSRRRVDEPDQSEIVEGSDVVGHAAQRQLETLRELVGTGTPLTQHREDADACRVRQRLDEARVVDVGDWFDPGAGH